MSEQSNNNGSWEQNALKDIALESIKEQRRRRRWGIFFKLFFVAYVGYFVWLTVAEKYSMPNPSLKPHTALVDVKGEIFDDSPTAGANTIAEGLRNAFADKNAKGIILRINSPGGSPVQASYVYNEINRLKQTRKDIKVYAVCVDLCASAAYYIASAADEIYANQATMVGSIGVLFNGFGFVDTMQKLGIERRLMTSGVHKGLMDPFSPVQDYDKQHLQAMLDTVHDQFINDVKKGRGTRLHETADMFSGSIWAGSQAKDLGLIDGFGSAGNVARDVIKSADIIDYTVKPNYFEKLASRFGASFAGELASKLGLNSHLS
jgi:protease-4